MDVSLSENQELLKKSAREFLDSEVTKELLHEVGEGGDSDGLSRLWQQMASLGWMGLAIDESHGGLGLSLVDVALLAEEMGRACLPGSWFATVALAAETIKTLGTDEQKGRWLPGIASGELRATFGFCDLDGRVGSTEITAQGQGDRYALDGKVAFVPNLTGADLVLVLANLENERGIFALEASQVQATQEPTLDVSRPLSTIALDNVEVGNDALVSGGPIERRNLESSLDRAASVLSAEMVGGSQRMLDDSVEYARVRHQFGRPIGSFQGVSHRCAEMLLDIEGARSLTYYAAWCCDEDPEAAPVAVAAAKAAAGDTFRSCTAQAIQIHGGIGFTWEAGLHYWYRRAFWSNAFLGDPVYHRERVASLAL